MQFCIFSAQYLPHLGGVENYTYHLAAQLIRMGHNVIVVTSRGAGLQEYEKMEGIEVYRLPGLNLLDGRYPVLNKMSAGCFRAMKRLQLYQIDLVIVNTRFYLLSVFGMHFAKKNGIPVITIEHGTGHLSVENAAVDQIGAAWEHFITRIGNKYCKDYYGVSKACCRWLKHFGIQSKGVIYNSIDWERAEKLIRESNPNYRKQLGISDSAKVVTYTGRFIEAKGIKHLIAAVEAICHHREDVYLVLAGDGELMDYVRMHQSNHIIPVGRLDEKNVWSLLTVSDIFCLPSCYPEGFPTSLLEAAACECYLISTGMGGAGELITDNRYGTIIKEGSSKPIYDAILNVLDDESYRKKCAGEGKMRVKNHFTWEITAKRVIKLAEERKNR